jgi:hypothetical protein
MTVPKGRDVAPHTRYVELSSDLDPATLIERLNHQPWVALAEKKRGRRSADGTNSVRVVYSDKFDDDEVDTWLVNEMDALARASMYVESSQKPADIDSQPAAPAQLSFVAGETDEPVPNPAMEYLTAKIAEALIGAVMASDRPFEMTVTTPEGVTVHVETH